MKTTMILAAAVLFTAPALAQQTSKPMEPAEIFASADMDKSGSLSLAEVQAKDARVTKADFDKYDTDDSDDLSASEFEAWIKATSASNKPTAG